MMFMHKLDRSLVTPPDCLAEYDNQTKTWADLEHECKSQLRFALVKMQSTPDTTEEAKEYGVRCAYCEGAIYHAGHIEHFRRKNPAHFPELTFEWTNLFLACGSEQHCGHYKDRPSAPSYDPVHLIKPDEHDPEQYLYFHSSGDVRVREGLENEEDKHKANETIRVFGLNNAPLPSSRARAVSMYKQTMLEDLAEITAWDAADREAFLQAEIDATQWEPYSTTIKHFLQHTN